MICLRNYRQYYDLANHDQHPEKMCDVIFCTTHLRFYATGYMVCYIIYHTLLRAACWPTHCPLQPSSPPAACVII